MLAYDDIGTYTFVFVYSKEDIRRKGEAADVGAIVNEAGFSAKGEDGSIHVDLLDFVDTEAFDNPQLLELAGGEAYLECKTVPTMASQWVEVQLGWMLFHGEGLFHRSRYSVDLRDHLVGCVDSLIGLNGFEFGFSLHLGDDHNELEYRDWFRECIVRKHFSLSRLVNHQWISIHSIAAGGRTLEHYGREVFESCPAWRLSSPSPDSVNVMFDAMCPGGPYRAIPDDVSYVPEAFAHLRAKLVD